MLEQAGFNVYVPNLNSTGGAMPELGFSIGISIMVSDSEVDSALELLAETVPAAGAHMVSKEADLETNSPKLSLKYVVILAVLIVLIYTSIV